MKRDWLTLTFGVVLVGTVVGLSLRQNMTRPAVRARAPEPSAAVAPAPAAMPAPPPAAASTEPRPVKASTAVVAGKPRAAAPSASLAATAIPDSSVAMQVQSDVQGASVFLDREFVGTTPLTLNGLTPGQKQLNVTATGHEGYAATIDLTQGQNRINVEFLKVRLNASVPVVHRHAMGSCQGTLAASGRGLSYDTANKADAFTLGFADLEEFDVDYLKKNLRVRRRAGKTWNFTNDNADALFAFHKDVAKAKDKLARP